MVFSNMPSSVHGTAGPFPGVPGGRFGLGCATPRRGRKEVWSSDCLGLCLDLKRVLLSCFQGGGGGADVCTGGVSPY